MAHHHATAAERFAGTHHSPLRTTALGALSLAALLAADHRLGKRQFEKTNPTKEPELIDKKHRSDHLVLVLPGCRTNVRDIIDLLEPKLGNAGTTSYVAYPEEEFSLDTIGQKLIEKRQEHPGARASVYAISMAGMVVAALGARPTFREAFGPLDTVIFDSSPGTIDDIQPKMRKLLETASFARNSFVASKVAGPIMTRLSARHEHGHEPGISEELVARHRYGTAHASLPFVAHERDFMKAQRGYTDGTLHGWIQRAYYLHGPNDHVVNTWTASEYYSRLLLGNMIDIEDSRRSEGSHAAGPEFPTGVTELLLPQHQLIAA